YFTSLRLSFELSLYTVLPICPKRSTKFFSSCRSLCLPDFHSFPTRRSSDLKDCALPLASTLQSLSPAGCFEMAAFGAVTLESSRSEEHTSELQSRENLVCRLLLEKKKVIFLNKILTIYVKTQVRI